MTKGVKNNPPSDLPLAVALTGEVKAWADQGWQGVTQTTYELLAYWFNRGEEDGEGFHECQRRAAVSWCKTASQALLPDQPREWEYFMLSEKTFNENRQLGFDALADLGRLDLERLLSGEAGRLF